MTRIACEVGQASRLSIADGRPARIVTRRFSEGRASVRPHLSRFGSLFPGALLAALVCIVCFAFSPTLSAQDPCQDPPEGGEDIYYCDPCCDPGFQCCKGNCISEYEKCGGSSCIEGGPYPQTNWWCDIETGGAITNSPTVSPTSANVCVGASVNATISDIEYKGGAKCQTLKYDCQGDGMDCGHPVGFALVKWWVDGNGGTVTFPRTMSSPGTYVYTAKAQLLSSDAICPDSGIYTLGTVTVTVGCDLNQCNICLGDGTCSNLCGRCQTCVSNVCSDPPITTSCLSGAGGYFSGGSASSNVVCAGSAITFSASASPVAGTVRTITTHGDCSVETNDSPDNITGTGFAWSLYSGSTLLAMGTGSSITTNLPAGLYTCTFAVTATQTKCPPFSTSLVATGTVVGVSGRIKEIRFTGDNLMWQNSVDHGGWGFGPAISRPQWTSSGVNSQICYTRNSTISMEVKLDVWGNPLGAASCSATLIADGGNGLYASSAPFTVDGSATNEVPVSLTTTGTVGQSVCSVTPTFTWKLVSGNGSITNTLASTGPHTVYVTWGIPYGQTPTPQRLAWACDLPAGTITEDELGTAIRDKTKQSTTFVNGYADPDPIWQALLHYDADGVAVDCLQGAKLAQAALWVLGVPNVITALAYPTGAIPWENIDASDQETTNSPTQGPVVLRYISNVATGYLNNYEGCFKVQISGTWNFYTVWSPSGPFSDPNGLYKVLQWINANAPIYEQDWSYPPSGPNRFKCTDVEPNPVPLP